MKKKVKFAAAAVVFALLIILCHQGAEKLRRQIEAGRAVSGTGTAVRNTNLVVLDAGHGGIDAGKTGANGAEEKEINLKIAMIIKEILEEADVEVIMTRTDDQRLADTQVEDLKKRTEIMNEANAVLAVSIHQNSYHEESVHGGQVFYYTDSAEGKTAAEMIQNSLRTIDPENTKEAKANHTYYILKRTKVPVVIAECGFLSNYAEAEKLASEEYQREVAEAVAEGILQYIESTR
ncbi:hypothetical protein B5F07_20585 [Lachnoclostridium sp. An169]|uniref:N-acetylmuramoyl-L-alanine amidase n=1 Tax=Lachnoclostridium sp. An169 TaxID=1965569 RepID=UPI000B565397|nr:N-acetylmuramoyl-L-alanine amidase [Lachnoclostridium sp. An169]OUP80624.1 hypothetical protein B5F07_20585 [Lachnoclostridium sp. An169]